MVGEVQISVLEVGHNSVKLGINDPSATPRYRVEVLYLPSDNDGFDGGCDYLMTSDQDQFDHTNSFAVPIL